MNISRAKNHNVLLISMILKSLTEAMCKETLHFCKAVNMDSVKNKSLRLKDKF